MTLSPGDIIDDKYEIVRLLGEGGMGAVFEGRNRLIERRVAIKVLHAAAREAAGVVERFEREARAAGMIGGDHILEVLDLGTLPGGARYMVMEFLDGETLAQRITRRGRLPVNEIVPLLRQALVGLKGAHAAGIVHRDLKPDNLFIMREKAGHKDFLKLIDFGVSKFGGLSSELRMTKTGSVMGTPYYMSPEQAKGSASVNHQSDLYSLGVIAFEALTGQVPFEGTSFNDLMFKIVLSEMPDVERVAPDVDPHFAAVIRHAMAKDVARRYQTADEFLTDLEGFASPAVSMPGASQKNWSSGPVAPAPAPLGAAQGRTNAEWSKTNSEPPALPKSKGRVGLYVALGGGVAATLALGYFSLGPSASGDASQALVPDSTATVVTAPAPLPSTPPVTLPEKRDADAAPPVPAVAPSPGDGLPVASEPDADSGHEAAKGRPAPNGTRRTASRATPPAAPIEPVPPLKAPVAEPAKVAEPVEPPARKDPPPTSRPAATPERPVRRPTAPSRDFGY